MKIEKLKKLKNGKYQIELENSQKIITYDEVILKYNILYKKEISDSEYNDINNSNDYYCIYTNSIKLLTKKMYSIKEFLKYIEKYNIDNKDKDKLMNSLKSLKLLDDEMFAKAYVQDHFYLSNDGPIKIYNDLIMHNIDAIVIEDLIKKIPLEDINDKLIKLIGKKLKIAKGSNYMIKNKVLQDLMHIGYDKAMIEEHFPKDIDDIKSIEKDYDRILRDVSKKEKDPKKIEYKIKQKLYQKGYTSDSIEKIVLKKTD